MLRCRSALRYLTIAGLSAAVLGFAPLVARADERPAIQVPSPDAPTLVEAFRLARSHRVLGMAPAIIEITGTQRLTAPIRLGAEDGGTAEAPLIVRAGRGAKARIVGSVELHADSMAIPPDALARLPEATRPHVRLFRLPETAAAAPSIDLSRNHADRVAPAVPFELFDATGVLPPARWPNSGWAAVSSADADPAGFTVTTDRVRRWTMEDDAWAAGYWYWNWSYETRPVASVDAAGLGIHLAEPPHYGIREGARFFIYHLVSELDRPGEWVRLPDRRTVLVWPRSNMQAGEEIEASVAESLFVIDGARHIRFESLEFARSRGDAIRIENGVDIVITDSIIHWTGGRGVSISASRRSGVEGSAVADTGAEGVVLSGGDRMMLEPAGLSVTGSRISRFGRLSRTYRPGVVLKGVGNRAIGNLIEDGPHAAVVFSGNDHLIELNEIAGVLRETSDAGAIYTGRDWTARGTVIRSNFLHDIRPARGFETKGIYLDDMASGITVESNLFLRVDKPVFLGGGRDNHIRGNLFVSAAPGISLDGRGLTWARPDFTNPDDQMVAALAATPYRSPVWRHRYPSLARMTEAAAAEPSGNRSDGNLFVGEASYSVNSEAQPFASGLGPDMTISPDWAGAAADAQRARDVAEELTAAGLAGVLPDLPFERMDRAGAVPSQPMVGD